MEINRTSHTGSRPGLDRRTFFRRILRDACAEFARLDGPVKIIETGLLTAMGAVGLRKGFLGSLQTPSDDLRMASRGVDDATVAYVQDDFPSLRHRFFDSTSAPGTTFETGFQLITHDDPFGPSPADSDLRLLVYWRMGKESSGLMGLGEKIAGLPFDNEDIDFVLNLVDNMFMALQAVTARTMIRTLENELQQAREQIREKTQRNETIKKELERSLFRMSGFSDIFQELSGLHQSQQVIEAFLLVLIGIFSARNGSILYYDADTAQAKFACRGSGSSVMENLTNEQVRLRVESIFTARRASALTPLQAQILPVEHLPETAAPLARENLVIIFRLDETAKGLLLLGPRLVDSRYGPRERELLLAFAHNFLVFLKNSKSFETIQRLNAEQEQKNIALEQSIQALSTSRKTIVTLETAVDRVKTLIGRAMARSTRVSLADICAVVAAGLILGLIYNFASPAGIPIIPVTWRHPSSPQVDVLKAEGMLNTRSALFVDARPPEFYNQGHVAAAVNLPPALFDFIYMMHFNRLDPELILVVYGRTISRRYDEEIAYRLRDRGHSNVLVLAGGIGLWQSKGLPVEP